MAQIKLWKTQEYFMYFKIFKGESWGKRSTVRQKALQEVPLLRCKLYPEQRRGEAQDLPDRFEEAAGSREQLRD